jgi:hypothetical protein
MERKLAMMNRSQTLLMRLPEFGDMVMSDLLLSDDCRVRGVALASSVGI